MKKYVWVIVGMSLFLFGCSNTKALEAELESQREQIESLSADNTRISEELESVSGELELRDGELKTAEEAVVKLQGTLDEMKKEVEVQEGDVTVTVTNKGEIHQDSSNWIFSDYCTMEFDVKNNTDKDIQGVQGSLKVMDLFGEKILTIGCDFTGKVIPAGESIVYDGLTYEVNQFISEQTKYFNTAFADLKFEYNLTGIVFTDGTTKN